MPTHPPIHPFPYRVPMQSVLTPPDPLPHSPPRRDNGTTEHPRFAVHRHRPPPTARPASSGPLVSSSRRRREGVSWSEASEELPHHKAFQNGWFPFRLASAPSCQERRKKRRRCFVLSKSVHVTTRALSPNSHYGSLARGPAEKRNPHKPPPRRK